MRLYVNLIPAIAYALVTMFSNMAGVTREVEKPSKKRQIVSLQVEHPELYNLKNCVLVAKNGQLLPDSFFEFFPGPFSAMYFSPSAARLAVGYSYKSPTKGPSYSETT